MADANRLDSNRPASGFCATYTNVHAIQTTVQSI